MSVKYIYHMGDIHIPNNINRHFEYLNVFNCVYTKLKEDPNEKIIVICGDLFHDKTTIKPETLILAKEFIFKLSKYGIIIIIDGNHDININNDDRLSSIEAMLKHLETDNNIHYLKENKIYKIKGINFGLTMMNSKEVTCIENKIKNEKYIGLYHGTLYKSKTDLNYEFEDVTMFSASNFSHYDITMLSDIHKFQYLNKNKTIAYSSSLIQQNFGESERMHGMLKWNISTLESIFIEIPNDYIFKTHLITSIDNYIINGLDNKNVRLRLRYNSIDRENIKNYENNIKKKYNIISISSEEITEDIEKNELKEEDILNKKILDVFNDFIKKNNIDENIKITTKLKELIDAEQENVEKVKRVIKIKEIEFENLFSYGSKNKINFQMMNGLNIIIGKNGLGKSAIVDIILFTLFNKFSRGDGKEALNIRHLNGKSSLKIELNGNEYIIKRYILKNNKTDVKLYENGQDITEDGKIRTDQKIIELFGTYEDMIMTSIILQVGNNFIDIDDKDKKNILINILGLNLYDNIYLKCKKEFFNISSNILKNLDKELTNKDYTYIIAELKDNILLNKEDILSIDEEIKNIEKEELIIRINLEKNKCNNIEKIIMDRFILNKKRNENNKKCNDILLQLDFSLLEINEEKNKLIKYNENANNHIILLSKKIIPINENLNNTMLKNEKNVLIKQFNNDIIQIKKKLFTHMDLISKIKNELKILESDNFTILIKDYQIKLSNITEKLNIKKNDKLILTNIEFGNKNLLKHKFNINCTECKYNKEIHEEMGYLKKISELKNKIKNCTYDTEDQDKLNKQLEKLIELKELQNQIDLLKNQIDILTEKKLLEENKLEKIEYNINCIIDNKKYEDCILNYNNSINKNLTIYKYILDYEKIIKENQLDLIEINKLDEIILQSKNLDEEIKRLKEIDVEKLEINERNKINKIKYDKLLIESLLLEEEYKKQLLLKKQYDKYNEKRSILKEILNLYERGFREYIMSKKISIFESKINNIIRNISNYEIKIEIDTKYIKFYKKMNDDKLLNIRELCGYERIAFNIGFRLSLNAMNVMSKNNFLIIDEGFSASDQDNLQKIPYLLEIIKKEYDIALIISHIDEIKNQDGRLIKINYNTETKDSNICIY